MARGSKTKLTVGQTQKHTARAKAVGEGIEAPHEVKFVSLNRAVCPERAHEAARAEAIRAKCNLLV